MTTNVTGPYSTGEFAKKSTAIEKLAERKENFGDRFTRGKIKKSGSRYFGEYYVKKKQK